MAVTQASSLCWVSAWKSRLKPGPITSIAERWLYGRRSTACP
jgi:hypothetical protein